MGGAQSHINPPCRRPFGHGEAAGLPAASHAWFIDLRDQSGDGPDVRDVVTGVQMISRATAHPCT